MRCDCGLEIGADREMLGLTFCIECAKTVEKVRGFVNYDKTAGDLTVVSSSEFARFRSYAPYGKYTGRGSGVHRMSPPTDGVSLK